MPSREYQNWTRACRGKREKGLMLNTKEEGKVEGGKNLEGNLLLYK